MPKRQLNVKVKLLTSQSIYISTQPWPWPPGSGLNNETLPYANSKQINIFKTEIFCCNLKKEKKYTFIWAGFWKYLHPHENKHTKTLQKKKKGAKATGGKITLTTKNPNQSEHKEPQHNAQPDIKRGDKGAPRQNLCFPEWRFFFFFPVATNIFHVSKHRGKSYVYQITINMWAFHLISPVRIFLNPSWIFLLEWPLKVESQSSPTNSDLII